MTRLVCLLAGLFWLVGLDDMLAGPVAELGPQGLIVHAESEGVVLQLDLTHGVPWRVRLHDRPMRVEVDFEEVLFGETVKLRGSGKTAIRAAHAGSVREGLARLVVELARPMQVVQAGMRVDTLSGGAMLTLRLHPTDRKDFQNRLARPDPLGPTRNSEVSGAPLVVLLDPGHGGRDSGARANGLTEAGMMLIFARELQNLLHETTDFSVHLTRTTDRFVSLEDRISQASAIGADVLISLHADALSGQQAQGAAVYTLSPEARASADDWLQTRRPGEGMLQSVDLTGQGSDVASALLELSRRHTSPRSLDLAHSLVGAVGDADLLLYKKPEKQGNFVVLRSADVPSVLVELGFLSHPEDLDRLTNPVWRGFMARALRDGLVNWSVRDYNQRILLRQ